MGEPVTGIKEDTYCREHWVFNANNESWLHPQPMMYCMVANINNKIKIFQNVIRYIPKMSSS